MKTLIRLLPVFLLTGALAQVATNAPIDWNHARELQQRRAHGETLTPEERAYLTRAVAERDRQNKPASTPAVKVPLGIKPLNELDAGEKYKGEEGGLYGAGQNAPPAALLAAARRATGQIRPLDAAGNPAKEGRVGVLAVGMSNTTAEFSQFIALADAEPVKSPAVVLVDGAQGGRDARAWVDGDEPWKVAAQCVAAAGITPDQVQVVWIKQALAGPAGFGEFPAHARKLQGDLEQIIAKLKDRYHNLRMIYLSSRIYAGYATTILNPEPYAFESAFAVRWVIQSQPADGPVILWGPYFWNDGATWRREDFREDGTHPSPAGRQKVARQLLNFFMTDPLAKLWFVK